MAKIDHKKELKTYYRASAKQVVEVDVPAMNFLRVEGKGEPGAPPYVAAVEALYSVSYTIKFMVKKAGTDYGVLPLEGLWWADDMADFVNDNKANWRWIMMIMQPPLVDTDLVKAAIGHVKEKKQLAAIDNLSFESFKEGLSAQILHVGPFAEEGPTIERVHAFIQDSGRSLSGKHHEIYLSDIRRAAPENWKTIIRQPMQ
ncbi:MAG: GyrI-like domain-containing protein [Bacteroidota bacterium]